MKSLKLKSVRHRQRGVTLIELMIAMLIGLFLIAGLVTLVGAMKRTNGIQDGLTQLQDNERLAATLLTDVVQTAGYFPAANLTTGTNEFAAATIGSDTFGSAGQTIVGSTGATATTPDTITVRYETQAGDGVINCMGGSYTGAGTVIWVNRFSLNTATNTLTCTLSETDTTGALIAGTAPIVVPLVTGISNFKVQYGLKTNTANTFTSVDSYLDAGLVNGLDQLTAGWQFVMSVSLQLTFVNPLATTASGAAVPGQPPTISFSRVINAKYQTGLRS
jgi:type IV pilus assembly protein PilW